MERTLAALGNLWSTMVNLRRDRASGYLRVLERCVASDATRAGILLREHNMLIRVLDVFLGDEHAQVGISGSERVSIKSWCAHILEFDEAPSALLPLLRALVCATTSPPTPAPASPTTATATNINTSPKIAATSPKSTAPSAGAAPSAAVGPDSAATGTFASAATDTKSTPAPESVAAVASSSSSMDDGTGAVAMDTKGDRSAPALIERTAKEDELLRQALPRLLGLGLKARDSSAVGKILQHLCLENAELSEHVCLLIGQGLKDVDYDGALAYFRAAGILLQMTDPMADQRIASLMGHLTDAVLSSRKFWRVTEFSIEQLLLLAKKYERAKRWLHDQPLPFKSLCGWLNQNPTPPSIYGVGFGFGRHSYYDSYYARSIPRKLDEEETVLLRRDRTTYGNGMEWESLTTPTGPAADKLALMSAVLAGEPLPAPKDDPADVDPHARTFKLGSLYDCYTRSAWCVVRIARVSGAAGRVEVFFLGGFAEKWNETVEIGDSRLQALGFGSTRKQIDAAIAQNSSS